MEDDGRKLRVTAVHPSGRRTFDPVSKLRLIENCLHPGASVAQLALDHGVNANFCGSGYASTGWRGRKRR